MTLFALSLVVLHHKLLPQSPPDNRLRAQLRLLQKRGLTQCIGRFRAYPKGPMSQGGKYWISIEKEIANSVSRH